MGQRPVFVGRKPGILLLGLVCPLRQVDGVNQKEPVESIREPGCLAGRVDPMESDRSTVEPMESISETVFLSR